jgi:hypothetical protein
MSNAQYYTLPDELLAALRAATASARAEGFRAGVEAAAKWLDDGWPEHKILAAALRLKAKEGSLSPERAERGEGDASPVCPVHNYPMHATWTCVECSQPAPPASGAPRTTGGSTLPGAMTPEFVHAREVAVALDRWRGGDKPEALEADYGFPGGMLDALREPASGAPLRDIDLDPPTCPKCEGVGLVSVAVPNSVPYTISCPACAECGRTP